MEAKVLLCQLCGEKEIRVWAAFVKLFNVWLEGQHGQSILQWDPPKECTRGSGYSWSIIQAWEHQCHPDHWLNCAWSSLWDYPRITSCPQVSETQMEASAPPNLGMSLQNWLQAALTDRASSSHSGGVGFLAGRLSTLVTTLLPDWRLRSKKI